MTTHMVRFKSCGVYQTSSALASFVTVLWHLYIEMTLENDQNVVGARDMSAVCQQVCLSCAVKDKR